MKKYDESVDFSGDSELRDKSTAIKRMVRSFELRLKGHIWSANGDKFTYDGEVLSGSRVIQKAVGLLQPFCEDHRRLHGTTHQASFVTTRCD